MPERRWTRSGGPSRRFGWSVGAHGARRRGDIGAPAKEGAASPHGSRPPQLCAAPPAANESCAASTLGRRAGGHTPLSGDLLGEAATRARRHARGWGGGAAAAGRSPSARPRGDVGPRLEGRGPSATRLAYSGGP